MYLKEQIFYQSYIFLLISIACKAYEMELIIKICLALKTLLPCFQNL